MPKGYEEIKAAMKAKGLGDAAAKTHAAKIWNASKAGKVDPVTNHGDGAKKVGVKVKKK